MNLKGVGFAFVLDLLWSRVTKGNRCPELGDMEDSSLCSSRECFRVNLQMDGYP